MTNYLRKTLVAFSATALLLTGFIAASPATAATPTPLAATIAVGTPAPLPTVCLYLPGRQECKNWYAYIDARMALTDARTRQQAVTVFMRAAGFSQRDAEYYGALSVRGGQCLNILAITLNSLDHLYTYGRLTDNAKAGTLFALSRMKLPANAATFPVAVYKEIVGTVFDLAKKAGTQVYLRGQATNITLYQSCR